MRVCHIGFNHFPGRGLTIFYEFARNQARQGLEVTAVAPGRPDDPVFTVLDEVRVHRLPLRSIGRFSFERGRFLRYASRIVREEKFDLVHVYAFVGAGALPLLARTAGSVWLYDCQTSAIKPPLLGLQNRMIRAESYAFDAITVLSEGIRDIVFGRRASIDAIVPLGANFEHFKPRSPDRALMSRLGISGTHCIFVYCGTLDHNRRIDKLIDAFARLAREDETSMLLVIGDGSALGDLRKQARAQQVHERIVFTGFVPYAEIPAYLSVATVALAFVPMDPCFEHQPPTKTVEYLAQGLPVIATGTAGNRLFVRHGANGLLCSDEPAAHAHAMLTLARDAETRARLAAAARESVSGFDWSEIVRTHVIPTYHRVIDARRPAT